MKQKINPLEKRERNLAIYNAYVHQNARVKDLARQHGISTVSIYHIIHAIGEKIRSGEIKEDE